MYIYVIISLAQGFSPPSCRWTTWRLLWQSVPISLTLQMCSDALKKLTLWQVLKKIRHFGPKSYEPWPLDSFQIFHVVQVVKSLKNIPHQASDNPQSTPTQQKGSKGYIMLSRHSAKVPGAS